MTHCPAPLSSVKSSKSASLGIRCWTVPKSYRDKVLQLAYNENHLGMRKTTERIKLSFYWPNVSNDVENYCRTCEKCQLKSPVRQSDKIPITPMVRAPYPFHTVNDVSNCKYVYSFYLIVNPLLNSTNDNKYA
ncbi:hypothetical protein AVEN_148331-1 [Araneus ventricosus]|uniref:RNA-directed DNA polymerase n=1 Tax=Araneus ventricosus TaxID=182803 RepID=A0A4Y2NNW7_ARAVE|nr:hypothetical protein AVEN_148331-1 [Araneus ventricosus]